MSSQTIDNKLSRILSKRLRHKIVRMAVYGLTLLILIACVQVTVIKDTDWERIGSLGSVWESVALFFPPDFSLISQLAGPTLETFMMACLGTMLAIVLSIPVTWFAAHNITPYKPITYPIGRAIMSLTRSVHEIVWAIIFVTAVGLGAFPGIIAVGMRSIGFVSKLTAEAIEDIHPGQLEAIRATGANQFKVILFGIVPQILPVYLGNIIFQWDINIRRATIMGLVGAGGLGLTFHRQMVMYNYGGVTTVIMAVLVLIGIGEVGSYFGRKAIT
jgi:phosphonate transport system permease protein